MHAEAPLCLVTGSTGYIGGRLVPELLTAGYRVRAMARTPSKLRGRDWFGQVEVAEADAQDAEALRTALTGVDIAYYLLHSIGTGKGFAATELHTAQNFADEAKRAGVQRIVYLGGLDPQAERLSKHLASRAEVGRVLLESGVPTVVLRAGVVIGSGSASFEMLRYLTERLPVMVTPRWVNTRIQPIAVRDVLRYLVACAALPHDVNRGFDIGGPNTMTYLEMMQRFAAVSGLRRRRILPVPVLSPSLSSHWVNVVTPVPRALARPLVESLKNTAVAEEHDIAAYVPDPPGGLISYERAVELALTKIQTLDVPTTWSSASTRGAPSEPLPSDPDWAGGSLYVDEREQEVGASPAALWAVIEGIGGKRGWYSFPLGWRVRGWLDRLTGGPGLARGRRDPDRLLPGDTLDWWRVEAVEPLKLLRLRAEMRLPGLAWLELSVGSDDVHQQDELSSGASESAHFDGASGQETTRLRQRALFHPRGIAGHVYWWGVWPFHGIVFGSMQRNIAKAAQSLDASRESQPTPRRPG
ncbi:MAG: SDR family oxidoreductase [Nocardioidaceae bacterium]|nr:SDR family oxidoreductase [Nocardioidaceae bacterium]